MLPIQNLIKLSALPCLLLASNLAAASPQIVGAPDLERMVDVGGYSLHFSIIPGHGTPILFEAGGGDDAAVWSEIAPSVAAVTGAPVLTYDRAGFGKSGVRPNGGDAEHGILSGIADLERALTVLGYQREIVLVGHSYGGFYSTLYTARHPDKVRYAVLIDANYACWFTPDFTRKLWSGIQSDLPKMKAEGSLGKYYQSANLPQTVEIMRRAPFPATVPAIDLVSENPPFADKEDVDRWNDCHREYARAAPNREAITAYGTGHYIFRDNPTLVVDEIVKAYASTVEPSVRLRMLERGMRYAASGANEARRREAAFRHSEEDLNGWGYRLISQDKLPAALDVFRLNTELRPDSWNAYDSYGEALVKAGRKDEAIAAYRKSVALNPDSANGKAALKNLGTPGNQ
jgi:pimeloyl-ACP methyl ester carboxylesterase